VSVPSVALGDIAEFIRGVTYKPVDLMANFSNGSIVCMRTANVQKTLKESDLLSIPRTLVKNKSKVLQEGDLLVSTANSWNLVGKCCWVPALDYAATAGGFIAVLRGDQSKVDLRYLYHWFRSPDTQADARNCGRQTTNISNMDINRCLALQMPLPPLPEQRRIAAILDKADALRAKRREAITKLDQLLQSVFLEMFGDPVTNPKGWQISTIGDECNIGSGSTPSRQVVEHFEGDIPWVKSTEVNWGRIVETGENVSAMGQKAARLKIYPADTVVVALYGQGTTRGKCAVLDIPATMNQACAGIHPSTTVISKYLFHYLKGSYTRLRGESRGGNQENLNLGILKSFALPMPPLELQQQFARFSQCLEKQIDQSLRSAETMNKLFFSFQHQAFAGDIKAMSSVQSS